MSTQNIYIYIFKKKKKKIALNHPKPAAMGFSSRGSKTCSKPVVNEPWVFEPLKVYDYILYQPSK